VSTINVAADGHYAGNGSKHDVISRSGMVIFKVASNVATGDFHKTAIIENLIIDGRDSHGNISAGSVGILLQNVYNCIIRNVTILNCEVGIQIENTGSYASQSNRIEHVRMTNVNTGILFTASAGNPGDFGFTTIKDVGIKLSDTVSSNVGIQNVGIQIGKSGNPVAKLYSSFIKATVWLGKNGVNSGMIVCGELKYSLVMFIVECPDGNLVTTGRLGVDITNSSPNAVFNNQSFMLTYDNKRIVSYNLSSGHDIVTEIL